MNSETVNNGPTNGGSMVNSENNIKPKAKVIGGQIIIDEKENTVTIPPQGAMEARLPSDVELYEDAQIEQDFSENEYVTIALVPDVIQQVTSEAENQKTVDR